MSLLIGALDKTSVVKCFNVMSPLSTIEAIANCKLNCASAAVRGLGYVRLDATMGGTVQVSEAISLACNPSATMISFTASAVA